jgi:hypothetical protein
MAHGGPGNASCWHHRRILVRQSGWLCRARTRRSRMLILAVAGHGVPLNNTELERWTRVGYERGSVNSRGER